jgi:hypothetical protein
MGLPFDRVTKAEQVLTNSRSRTREDNDDDNVDNMEYEGTAFFRIIFT